MEFVMRPTFALLDRCFVDGQVAESRNSGLERGSWSWPTSNSVSITSYPKSSTLNFDDKLFGPSEERTYRVLRRGHDNFVLPGSPTVMSAVRHRTCIYRSANAWLHARHQRFPHRSVYDSVAKLSQSAMICLGSQGHQGGSSD